MPDRPRDRCLHRPRALAAVVAALAIVSIAVTGCGGGGDEGTAGASTTPSATTESGTPSDSTTTSSSTTSTGTTTGQAGRAHTTIRQAVDAVLVSGDSAKACGSNYVTEHYLEVAYGGTQGCVQAQSPKSAANSLRFEQVRMRLVTHSDRPPEALANVVPDGGLYGGDEITVVLVKEGAGWRVDSLKSNAPVGP